MAYDVTASRKKKTGTIKLSPVSQTKLLTYINNICSSHRSTDEVYDKMTVIDQAYARYQEALACGDTDGIDRSRETTCGDVFASDRVTAPIVVSQVDSMVAYLAEVFLSGSPLFPVVSNPKNRKWAEQLEVLMDDHATLGGWVRQFLMMFRDGAKYNISAVEVPWEAIDSFSVIADFSGDNGQKIDRAQKYMTKVKRLSMYNTIWDQSVNPGDVAAEGDFGGYVEIISKVRLKRLLNKLTLDDEAYNVVTALSTPYSGGPTSGGVLGNNYYREDPTISEYISATNAQGRAGKQMSWESYITGDERTKHGAKKVNMTDGSFFQMVTMYVRILPSDFDINVPQENTVQIWQIRVINGRTIISAKRIISAFDWLPILFGQPLEDGMGLQTKSLAEGAIPFQNAASTLYNIRFSAARRAVSDRALYNPDLIDPDDVNNPSASAKIPVRIKSLMKEGLESAYRALPFSMQGLETVISDASVIIGLSQQLSGINGPQQGMFQKGNKSVTEWEDTTGNADSRLRLPALCYECQVFAPFKQIAALNIFQYGDNVIIVSQKNGEVVEINIAELRKQVLAFRIADGYTPKSKMASTEVLTNGFNMLMNSPILQQAYGTSLPAIFAHMMSLGGVRDFDQYNPEVLASQEQQAPANLQQNQLQDLSNPAQPVEQTQQIAAPADPTNF